MVAIGGRERDTRSERTQGVEREYLGDPHVMEKRHQQKMNKGSVAKWPYCASVGKTSVGAVGCLFIA